MNEEVLESYQSLEGKRILLAEDNELNAEIAQVILEGCGISADWVNDGIECVGKVIQKTRIIEIIDYNRILMQRSGVLCY